MAGGVESCRVQGKGVSREGDRVGGESNWRLGQGPAIS